MLLTQADRDELGRMAREANAAFAAACRDPNITKEDYEKLRRQYQDAMNRNHAAHGVG